MGINVVRGPAEARALAKRLNCNERVRPLAVVSTPATSPKPWIDVDDLERDFGALVDIHVIRTGPDTWALTGALPPDAQVYGGAGRIYPVGHEWTRDVSCSPLRFAFDLETGRRATRDLVADGLGMAAAAGLLEDRAAAGLGAAHGTVKGLPTPDRAVVELSDRSLVAIAQELTLPEVPLDRILTKDMAVVGVLDHGRKRLDIRRMIRPPTAITYPPGRIALAVVREATPDAARFQLFPGLDVTVHRSAVSSNELDDLRTLFTIGDVTTVRVLSAGPDWSLSLIDIDDDEVPCEAVSIVEGGPPWLVPPPPPEPCALQVEARREPEPEPSTPAEPTVVDLAAEPMLGSGPVEARMRRGPSPFLLDPKRRAEVLPPSPGPCEPDDDVCPQVGPSEERRQVNGLHNTIAGHKAELRAVRQQLQALKNERDLIAERLRHTQGEVNGLKSEAKRLRTALLKKSRSHGDRGSSAGLFADASEEFRHHVYLAWTKRIPAADKSQHGLPAYELGPGFLESVKQLEGIKASKIHDVVVEVLTGLVKDIEGRELHRLRTADSGGAPPLTREDGALAWRASLQIGAPSARRLHYWQLPDGTIELAKVCVHDDFTA